MEILTTIWLVAAAFLGGFIDSIAGGGGLIALPALLATGMPAHMALGTSKFQGMCGTTSAIINFQRNQKIIWKVAFFGIPFALIGSVLGARLTLLFDPVSLARILIMILPPAAIAVFASKTITRERPAGAPLSNGAIVLTILACLTIGLYDGFFGPGTGTFLIVALVLFANMGMVNASATAKTFNLASNFGAFVTFLVSGHVNFSYAIFMAVANIGGNLLGSHLTIKHGASIVQKILVVSLTILFIYLIVKYY
jgi:uncharacterized membrane protein YfcA